MATGGHGDGGETSGVGENDVQNLEAAENNGPEAAAGLSNLGALPDSNIRRPDPQTSHVTGAPFVLCDV